MSNVYDTITDRIIKQLESGTAPWHKPWASRGDSGLPRNLRTLKPYRGINVWLLMSAGYSSQYFLTFKQAQELGGNVRKGEKGLPVVFWKFGEYEQDNKVTGETEKHDSVMVRYYTVFNVWQCEVLLVTPVPPPDTHSDIPAIDLCEQIVDAWTTRPTIKHDGDKASYHKILDYINMPTEQSRPARRTLISLPTSFSGTAAPMADSNHVRTMRGERGSCVYRDHDIVFPQPL